MAKEKTIRIPIRFLSASEAASLSQNQSAQLNKPIEEDESETSGHDTDEGDSGDSDDEEEEHEPELRIVEHDDPAAYNFSSPQYSAHKLPKDVVDASMAGDGGMREFAQRWQRIVEGRGEA